MRGQMMPAPLWSERSTSRIEDGVQGQRLILVGCLRSVTTASALAGDRADEGMVVVE